MVARLHPQPEGDVLEHRHVPEQRVVLEDEADPALADAALESAFSPPNSTVAVGRPLEPAMILSKRRLARTGRPEQRHQLARVDGQADVVERREVAEALRDVA